MYKFTLTLLASVLLVACSDDSHESKTSQQTTSSTEQQKNTSASQESPSTHQTTNAKSKEHIILKVAHFWPPSALAQKQVLEPWCEKISQESEQQLSCQFYPAMQLGGTPPQLIEQVADGVADIVFTLPGYTAGRFPSMEVMELPFLIKNGENGSRVAWKIYEEFGQKDFENVKPLAFNVHDRGHFHNNKHPINSVEDLQGLKMRAPTRLTNKLLAALGATPVSMPLPTMADALSKGVIDGYILPWEVVPTVKLHEMTKFHSEVNTPNPVLYSALFTIAMNKQRYDSLPDNLKKVIDNNSGEEFSASIGKAWDNSAPAAKQKALDHGNTVNEISDTGFQSILKAGETVSADWVKEVSAKGYDGQKILDRAKELVNQYQ
ncbi:TRAP transporter substrate-binding protein [Pelistega europaea]|uniref:TRAP transporter substrate-binding protein n=1 Tax=Pelistega europaea TaxID=106147 RepID=A0A7Y4L7W3_9BURK|nr:TRAP transporter substrate-binding protein [Pelistega europaea]NOL48572.1 TRAP transporter substrate-binding protein [Pelistega europaea]